MSDNLQASGQELSERADEILAEAGIDDPSSDQYLAALQSAEIELDKSTPKTVYRGDDGGQALHLCAMKILADNGKINYDVDDYAAALNEAARVLSIDLSGRGA